jgi:glycosyltransferase involved in cell wall biosynthesis
LPIKLSLASVVYNEAARLPGLLAHVRPFVDETVIVVQKSTDKTLWIAQLSASYVIEDIHHGYAEASRKKGMDACRGEWILILSPDERLTSEAEWHLQDWMNNPYFDCYNLRELTLVEGVVREDACHPRLFRAGTYTAPLGIHTEVGCTTGRVQTIDKFIVIEHFKSGEEQALDDQRYAALGSPSIPLPRLPKLTGR